MKKIVLLLVVLGSFSALAQRTVNPTDSLRIEGKIKQSKTFTLADLDAFPKTAIPDQIIYNHKGEIKDTVKNLKGVSLKTILEPIEFICEKPKNLNEFYFVFIASDAYKVVFSWNEIFNTETGNHFFLVTEKDGQNLKEMDNRILFISTADLQSGRRYIKGLERIEVNQVK